MTPLTRALSGTISEPHAGYLAFSLNEVAQILAAASGPRVTKAWQFWAPRIALFTGARVREAADLTVDDIVELAMERLFANGIREIALYDQFNDLLISWPAPRKQATPTRQ